MSSPSYNSHSPSSTISELNSPLLSISTRRPRTRRKRPNQTHDEAVALLSTVYPTIFSSSSSMLKPPPPPPPPLSDYDQDSELLMPFDQESDFRFNPSFLMKPEFHHLFEHDDKRVLNLGGDIKINEWEGNGFGIFDEEVEEGIDSFMGSIESGRFCQYQIQGIGRLVEMIRTHPSSMGLKSALRVNDDDVNWCRFATVEFEQISPDKEVAPAAVESKSFEQNSKLLLKLDYDEVLEAWSDKESPFSDNSGRLSEIDLFGESGIREASVLRYKEKRRNRLFSKSNSNKIRYQVRKLNADQRPRIKGRFMRSSNIRNVRRRAERI